MKIEYAKKSKIWQPSRKSISRLSFLKRNIPFRKKQALVRFEPKIFVISIVFVATTLNGPDTLTNLNSLWTKRPSCSSDSAKQVLKPKKVYSDLITLAYRKRKNIKIFLSVKNGSKYFSAQFPARKRANRLYNTAPLAIQHKHKEP